jgi:tRNA(Ile)-lysidine synthase
VTVPDLVPIAGAELAALGVAPDATALVACSGGPDSTALALVAAALRDRGRLGPVTLCYVDHGLREGARDEAARVEALAASLAAAARVVSARVDREQVSLEDAARRARYAALDSVADAIGAAVILVGHTASDQAETVLMRILRGTGLAGLAGIPPRRGRVVRPLLGVGRAAVLAYLGVAGRDFATDPMNRDPRFFRVRVRDTWLPRLREENPALDLALGRLALSAREQRAVLDYAAGALLERAAGAVATSSAAGPVAPAGLAVAALAEAPPAVVKRALTRAAEAVVGTGLSARHLRELCALVAGPDQGTRDLALPGAKARREYGTLRFLAAVALAAPVVVPGPAGPAGAHVVGPDGPYAVRTWQKGDRMRPARLAGRSRKLSDLFGDAKVPRALRSSAVVVARERDGEIVWTQHIGPAHGSAVEVFLTETQPVATTRE